MASSYRYKIVDVSQTVQAVLVVQFDVSPPYEEVYYYCLSPHTPHIPYRGFWLAFPMGRSLVTDLHLSLSPLENDRLHI